MLLLSIVKAKPIPMPFIETTQRKKKGITCNETESSKRVTDHSRGINALH